MNRTKEWNEARKKLKIIFQEKNITQCELRLEGCWINDALSVAHRKKRREYYGTDKLGDFNECILACVPCHQKIENDKQLTKYYFNKLRPK